MPRTRVHFFYRVGPDVRTHNRGRKSTSAMAARLQPSEEKSRRRAGKFIEGQELFVCFEVPEGNFVPKRNGHVAANSEELNAVDQATGYQAGRR